MKSKNNILVKIFGFLYKFIARHWWVHWSNLRFKNAIKENIPIRDEEKVQSLDDIKKLVELLYSKFKYTNDGIDQLGDAITPPPQNYQHYLDGQLKDDCDGFHSLVYHCLHNNNIECYLLSVIALGSSHCVLVLKYDGYWYVNDYWTVEGGYKKVDDVIDYFNKYFQRVYKPSSEVVANDLILFNYDTGKFELKPISKVEL